jgi:hypothetical protein
MEKAADLFGPRYPLIIGIIGVLSGIIGTLIGALIGAAGMYFSLITRINAVVEEKLNNETYMNKIISNLRPYAIFDQNESILADGGAMEYINNIKVNGAIRNLSVGEVKIPEEIIISPKNF